MTPDITERDVKKALGDFLSGLFSCEIVLGQENLVPMPQGSFILIDNVAKRQLSTNSHSYSDGSGMAVKTATEYRLQIDFYGSDAGDMAQAFLMLFNDGYAYEAFPDGIKPLYADSPKEIPLITAEKNYLSRWTMDVFIQYNPTVTASVGFIGDIPVSVNLANKVIL